MLPPGLRNGRFPAQRAVRDHAGRVAQERPRRRRRHFMSLIRGTRRLHAHSHSRLTLRKKSLSDTYRALARSRELYHSTQIGGPPPAPSPTHNERRRGKPKALIHIMAPFVSYAAGWPPDWPPFVSHDPTYFVRRPRVGGSAKPRKGAGTKKKGLVRKWVGSTILRATSHARADGGGTARAGTRRSNKVDERDGAAVSSSSADSTVTWSVFGYRG